MSNLYEELGVPKNADEPTIRKAYRKRARKAHPDRGGTNEEMSRVNKAYAVLADPMRRARYDSSGDEGDQVSEESAAASMISAAFVELLKKDIANNHIEWVVGWMRARKGEVERELAAVKKAIDYLTAKKGDIRYKGEQGRNLYASTVDHELRRLEASKSDCEHRIAICVEAIARTQKEYEGKPSEFMTTTTLVYSGSNFR